MKRILLLLTLLLILGSSSGQEVVDLKTFLDRSVNLATSKIQRTAPVTSLRGLGPLEKLELRSETDEFDFGRQEYTLRISPAGRAKIRAQKALAQHLAEKPDFKEEDLYCDLLTQAYGDWVDLFQIERELDILASLDSIHRDQETVLNRLTAQLDFEWGDLISLREARTELSLRAAELKGLQRRILRQNGLSVSVSLSFEGMVSLRQIAENITIDVDPPLDAEQTYKIATINRELAIERAEKGKILDFAQFRYRGPHDNPFAERFSLGVGFQLPNSNDRKLKAWELEVEEQLLQQEIALEELEDKRKIEQRLLELQEGVSQYLLMQETFLNEALALGDIAERLSRQDGFNPLSVLKIRERDQQNQLRLLDRYVDVLGDYLSLKASSGEICSMTSGELFP
ncbi:MAG: hypothetical protein AAGF89_14960 [Bacteroidota bacterium]